MYSNDKLSWCLYGVGLLIVVGSHIYILAASNLGLEIVPAHSYLNIFAGVLLIAGWLRRK